MEIINLALNNIYRDSCVKWGVIEISCVILNEIYFHYEGKFYTQKNGLWVHLSPQLCTRYFYSTYNIPILLIN